MCWRYPILSILWVLVEAGLSHAHPVARDNHDRTIVVHLQQDPESQRWLVLVNYRLEVDEFTVVFKDLKEFRDEIDPKSKDPYATFTRIYAPILANHLSAEVNGTPLTFACIRRQHTLKDDKGESLGHLRCDFVFQAAFAPRRDNRFTFEEGNYQLQEGRIDLSLAAAPLIHLVSKTEPDAALKARADKVLLDGEDAKLRKLTAVFTVPESLLAKEALPAALPPTEAAGTSVDDSRVHLLLNSNYGFWMIMLLSAGLGAAHALTPGHGKTLVAAYLVGQQGTIWHALLLGLITTLTHTGAVLVLAVLLRFAPQSWGANVQSGLGLAMGLVVTCFGFFVLLRRLSGRADHIHLGGGHHHHHHYGPGHHVHEHAHAHADHVRAPDGSVLARDRRLNTWGLIMLGVTGGLLPCTDAILILGLAVGAGKLWLALPMLLSFSAGLAGVLVLIGILVVQARNFASSKFGDGRLMRSLPIVSAVLVTLVGLWLCYESVHGGHGTGP
jgi:nickel/cobalt exporter